MVEAVNAISAVGWSETPVHPWHRFFSRMVDMWLNGIIYLWFVLMSVMLVDIHFLENASHFIFSRYGGWLDLTATAFVSVFINAAIIGATGQSLGKFLFGIRVVDKSGNKVGFKRAFQRELIIWCRCLGFGIPVVFLFPMYASFKALHKNGVAMWDERLGLMVEYKRYSKKRNILRVIGLIISVSWLIVTIESLVRPWFG